MRKHTPTRQIGLIVVINSILLLAGLFATRVIDSIMSPLTKQLSRDNEKLREDVVHETNIEKLRSLAIALVSSSDQDNCWRDDFVKNTTSGILFGGIVGGNIIGLIILFLKWSLGSRFQSSSRPPA